MVAFVAVALAGAAGLAAGLLAVPVELRLRSSTEAAPHVRLQVEWLFGWVQRELDTGGAPKSGRSGPSLRDWVAVWSAELQERVLGLLGQLRRRILLRELRVHGRLGLGDPAETGRTWALIAPLAAVAGRYPNVDLQLEPDFLEAGVRGEAACALRVVPITLVPHLVSFGCSRVTLRALRRVRARGRAQPR